MSEPVVLAGVAIVAACVAWYLNERSKRTYEDYVRKEKRYERLLGCLRGFYERSADRALREGFLTELNLCWLYCPDEVIRRAYAFLSTVETGVRCSDEEKRHAAGALILAIRRDLLARGHTKKTNLSEQDFRHLRAA